MNTIKNGDILLVMKRLKIKDIHNMKNKQSIVCLTSYTKSITLSIDKYVDILLIGDSLGSTIYGMKNTRSVNLEMMKIHGKIVFEASNKPFTIVDMPYKSYENEKIAYKNATDLLNYTKCQSIKIETKSRHIKIVKYLTKKGINVVSHIGVTPQSYSDFSKIKVAGKTDEEKNKLLDLAFRLEDAGSKILLLECVVTDVAREITSKIKIPTIGIGSSKYCDGQVLVIDDMLGIKSTFKKPKFVKIYGNLSSQITNSVKKYASDVKKKKFPTIKYSYK